MPDRHSDDDEKPAPITQADRELHAIALTIACRYCLAPQGEPCVNKTLPAHPSTRIPHTARTNDAIEVPF